MAPPQRINLEEQAKPGSLPTDAIKANAVTGDKLNANTAGAGLTYNVTTRALDANVDDITLQILNNQLAIKTVPLTGFVAVADVQFNNFQALKFRVENFGSDPLVGNVGRLIWRTDLGELRIDTGSIFTTIGGHTIQDEGNTLPRRTILNFTGPNIIATDTGTETEVNVSVSLGDITDVTLATPTVDQILKFNGAQWVNGSGISASAGNGIEFFMDDTAILPVDTNNVNELNSLIRTPTGAAEVDDTVVCNNNTVLAEGHLYDVALGRTTIDAGVWDFDTWAGVDDATGVSQVLINMCRVRPVSSETITTTGVGTSRTVTTSGGTYFALSEIDADSAVDVASYLQTPQGLYQITARTSDTEVTIETPSTYVNENAVAFSVWKRLFQVTTGEINNISPAYELFNTKSVQPSFSTVITDKLGELVFGTTTNTADTTITHVHNGTDHYSHVATPLSTLHNDLTGLQGGAGDERYHLTLSEHTVATQAASGSQSGYLTNTDWTIFNSKQAALGFTPENVANKSTNTSLGTSDSLYPSQNAVKTYADTKAPIASPIFTGTVTGPNYNFSTTDSILNPTSGTVTIHAAGVDVASFVGSSTINENNKIILKDPTVGDHPNIATVNFPQSGLTVGNNVSYTKNGGSQIFFSSSSDGPRITWTGGVQKTFSGVPMINGESQQGDGLTWKDARLPDGVIGHDPSGRSVSTAINGIEIFEVFNNRCQVYGDFLVTGPLESDILATSTVLITDTNKHIISSSITSTEIGYVSGVTSAIQTQLDGKVAKSTETDIGFIIDGSGAAITTGEKGVIQVPFACTITGWTILADQSGSIVFDIWKDTLVNYPPTATDTLIPTGTKPTLTTATNSTSSSLTGWTTSIAAGDILKINVDSAATVQRVNLILAVIRS